MHGKRFMLPSAGEQLSCKFFTRGRGDLGRLTTTPLPAPFLAASKRSNQLNLEVEGGGAEVRVE